MDPDVTVVAVGVSVGISVAVGGRAVFPFNTKGRRTVVVITSDALSIFEVNTMSSFPKLNREAVGVSVCEKNAARMISSANPIRLIISWGISEVRSFMK